MYTYVCVYIYIYTSGLRPFNCKGMTQCRLDATLSWSPESCNVLLKHKYWYFTGILKYWFWDVIFVISKGWEERAQEIVFMWKSYKSSSSLLIQMHSQFCDSDETQTTFVFCNGCNFSSSETKHFKSEDILKCFSITVTKEVVQLVSTSTFGPDGAGSNWLTIVAAFQDERKLDFPEILYIWSLVSFIVKARDVIFEFDWALYQTDSDFVQDFEM